MSNNYANLRWLRSAERARCAQRLLNLRKALRPVRNRKRDGGLLLATWNIRDFDSNKFGFGPRLDESFYYIAEIISCFDLVAVQEVHRDLSALNRVMAILGREWDFIATDATEGVGGNDERMAFVYNTEKVWFRKIAGEVVLPEGQLIVPPDATGHAAVEAGSVASGGSPGLQFARTPFVVAFQSGWFKFNLCTVHIYFGKTSGEKLQRRIAEIRQLVQFFADRQDEENEDVGNDPSRMENYVLLGDFNVVSPEHETMEALRDKGFEIPAEIDGSKVGKLGDHFYDQIAVRVEDPRFRISGGGMVDIFETVFRDTPEDLELYGPHLPASDEGDTGTSDPEARRDLYRRWRTWQLSDHRPLWIDIETDFADHYLSGLVAR